ncbi:MAG TPA: hypothetical protein VH593_31125, partial [Ktedonobacteraceae bacterium]
PYACQYDAATHCLTCADEAVAVKVVRIDWKAELALVVKARDQVEEQLMLQEEIDIMLVEDVAVGDILLAHGGVAIALLEKGDTHERRGN